MIVIFFDQYVNDQAFISHAAINDLMQRCAYDAKLFPRRMRIFFAQRTANKHPAWLNCQFVRNITANELQRRAVSGDFGSFVNVNRGFFDR